MISATEKEILGVWADEGYWTREYADHVITVGYKDEEIVAFSQYGATREQLQAACERHYARLTGTLEAVR